MTHSIGGRLTLWLAVLIAACLGANLLLLARGDEGYALNRRPVELDVLLEAALQAHTLAQGRRITVALGHEEQAQVAGDADLLKQLLLNLVDNARSVRKRGGQAAWRSYSWMRPPSTSRRCTEPDTGSRAEGTGQHWPSP